jgi:hypothetical protein
MGLEEIVLALLAGLLIAEVLDWLPLLTTFVIQTAARRLPEDVRSRRREEWLAEAEHIPGKVSRVCWALGLILASARMSARDREPIKRLSVTSVVETDTIGSGALAPDLHASEVTCRCSCGAVLDEPERLPCPRCGSTSRSIHVSISEGVVALAGASIEARTTRYQ